MKAWIPLLFAVSMGLVACDDSARVKELEAKVAELEGKLAKPAPAVPQPGAPGAPADAAAAAGEQEAAALLTEAQGLMKAGKNEEAVAKLTECKDRFGTTRTGARCDSVLTEAKLIGSTADPMAVSQWLQGDAKFSDSKATVVIFWELWCPHCKREVPKMEALNKTWKSKGVQIVGVTKASRGTTPEAIKEYIKQEGVTYPVGIEDNGKMSQSYFVRGVPAAAFVGTDGKIKWRGHPGELNDQRIAELLKS